MTKPAVVHACDYGAPYLGNFMASQLALAEGTREYLQLDSHFALPSRARGRPWIGEVESRGFSYTFLDEGEGRLRRGRRLAELVAQRRSIFHSHFYAFDLDTVIAAQSSGSRVVWHIQSGLANYPLRRRLSDLIKVRMIGRRRCDLLVACSDAAGEDSIRRGFGRDQVKVVPNAIALDRFPADSRQRELVRDELGVAHDATMFLSFCWDPERKGTDLAVEGMRRLREQGRAEGAVMVLVGQERLRVFVDRLHPEGLPSWLTIADPIEDVAGLYRAADAFVSAARSEGLPYAIGEAMASGLPVISSDIPWASHYFPADGVTTFPSEDVGALEAALSAALDPARREHWGAANRRFALSELGIDRYVERLLGEYDRLLDGPAGG
ncbi:MAG: glycosyltransferase family 4 protein [Actinomycetota bacterium]|nr:glycosyltransferase family 4 protein [Actinomycetota bacterium]